MATLLIFPNTFLCGERGDVSLVKSQDKTILESLHEQRIAADFQLAA
jgi:hypothetical protein